MYCITFIFSCWSKFSKGIFFWANWKKPRLPSIRAKISVNKIPFICPSSLISNSQLRNTWCRTISPIRKKFECCEVSQKKQPQSKYFLLLYHSLTIGPENHNLLLPKRDTVNVILLEFYIKMHYQFWKFPIKSFLCSLQKMPSSNVWPPSSLHHFLLNVARY